MYLMQQLNYLDPDQKPHSAALLFARVLLMGNCNELTFPSYH